MHWYAINTKPHQEKLAELHLSRLEVETFLPRLKRLKMVRRIRTTVIEPLFPGYVFARCDMRERYRAVAYAKGVRKIVQFGASPAEVDESLIASIKDRLEDGCVVVRPQRLTPGQTVRIHEGPFCGIDAIFERELSDKQRAVLLLRTIAFQARIVVPLEFVANA